MKACFNTTDDVTTVRLEGVPDPESIASFSQTCSHFLSQKKIVFNLDGLSFVGSSGIFDLIKTVQNLQKSSQIKFCNAGVEFHTILSSKHFDGIEIYESEEMAQKSFIE